MHFQSELNRLKLKWQPPEEMPAPGGPAEFPEPAPEQAPPAQPEAPVVPETEPSPSPQEVPADSPD